MDETNITTTHGKFSEQKIRKNLDKNPIFDINIWPKMLIPPKLLTQFKVNFAPNEAGKLISLVYRMDLIPAFLFKIPQIMTGYNYADIVAGILFQLN